MRARKLFGAVVAAAVLVAAGAAGATSLRSSGSDGPQVAAVQSSGAPKAIGRGSSVSPSRFVPISPCRIFDSRKATAGILQPGVARTVQVGGSAGFTAQGGAASGCGIPTYATAVEAAFTSTQATGNGYLRAWSTAAAEPTATILNWTDLGKAGITASATVPVSSTMKVKAFSTSSHLVVDATGYYVEAMAAYVSSSGSLVSWNGPVVSASRISTGYFQVRFATDVLRCTPSVQVEGSALYYGTAITSGQYAFVSIANLAVAGAPALDAPFSVEVEC